jgi:hypothetical protein
MKYDEGRVAEVSYSKDSRRLEVFVPQGTKRADLVKVLAVGDLLSRLPRGCPACISGDHLIIRERFDPVIRVDLDQQAGGGG